MAIPMINAQGTQVIIMDIPDPEWADDTEALTDIRSNGLIVGCPQTLGDISETRNVTEYSCLSTNDSLKSLGSIQRGNFDMELLLDPDDTAGQDYLRTMFKTNAPGRMVIELSDSEGTNGTMFYFNCYVSAHNIGIAQNEAVKLTLTVEISSEITEIPAG